MSDYEFKPKAGSWWVEREAKFDSQRFQVLMVGDLTAYCRRLMNGAESVVALGGWQARFTPFLPVPTSRVCYVIQLADGLLAGAYNEPPKRLDDGERVLRMTTTYELYEGQS